MIPILIWLVGLGAYGAARTEIHHLEKSAAREIGANFGGEHKEVNVHVDFDPEILWGNIRRITVNASHFTAQGLPVGVEKNLSHNGKLRDLRFDLSDFVLRDLRVAHLRVDVYDSRYDFGLAIRKHQFKLSRSGKGVADVELEPADLAAFIKQKFHEIQSVTVKIEGDKVYIDGHGEFLLLSTDFSIVAQMEPVDGTKLMLKFAQIRFDGMPAGEEATAAVLKVLNPVIDLDADLGLRGSVHINKIHLEAGHIRADGETVVPDGLS